MPCKHLVYDANTGRYKCALTKRVCALATYCAIEHRYTTNNCVKCPAFKPRVTKEK